VTRTLVYSLGAAWIVSRRSRPVYGTHRIGGIHDQVEQHLLQRHAFARDFRQGLVEFAAEDDLPSFQVAVNECENFAYQIVDAE